MDSALEVLRISFDPDPASEHLVDREGEPVWPLRSGEDHDALSAVASVFGAQLSATRGRTGATRAGWEEVVAVGAEHEAEARLHAHLTGRRFRGVRSPAALAVEATPAVVVTRFELLTPGLVDALHRGGAGPGFVVAAGESSLRRQVLRRAAAARLVAPIALPRADVFPFGDPVTRPFPVAGRGDPGDRVRALLGAGAGVLSVLTHSDGVDASLGDLVLCPMGEPVADADPARSPSCWSSGICHRLARPLDEALTSGRIARADEIRCRMLVWNACFTLAYRGDPLDPRWSVLARLLEAPGIGALAIAPDLSHDSAGSLEPLAAALARGVRVGDALAEHNRHPLRRAIGARLVLFGDPRVGLPAARAATADPEPEAPAAPAPSHTTSGWPMLETLAAADLDSPAFFAAPARAALATLEGGAPEQEIRERFAELLACRVRAFTQWTSLSDQTQLRGRAAPCPRCAGPARQVGHTMRAPGLAPRLVTVCPRCQVVEDVPRGCDLTVAIQGDAIAISGTLPTSDWAARARLYAQVPWNGPMVRWPAAQGGSPVRRLDVGPIAASGVHQVTFVVVWGREYAAVTAREACTAAAALEKAS